jgi:hypothetical protein
VDWAALGAGVAMAAAGLLLHAAYFLRLLHPPAFARVWQQLVICSSGSRLLYGAASLFMALAHQPAASLLATCPFYASSMSELARLLGPLTSAMRCTSARAAPPPAALGSISI